MIHGNRKLTAASWVGELGRTEKSDPGLTDPPRELLHAYGVEVAMMRLNERT